MGRPETPLDPGDGPVQSFAYDLRGLRARAGNVPYRVLSKRAHYSVAALSQAAAGRNLPSLAVTQAFVRACGGDVDEWERRWRSLNEADKRGSDLLASEAPFPVPPRGSAGARHWLSRLPWKTIIGMAAVAVCAAAITDLTVTRGGAGKPASAAPASAPSLQGGANPIADGSDPGRAGCGPDAVTMAWVNVHFPADQLSGRLELRYSPHCRAAWGRFEPYDGWQPGPGTMVTLWTVRPADQASQSYSVVFGGETIIGNILMTARGCVEAEVGIVRGSIGSPIAATSCVVIK